MPGVRLYHPTYRKVNLVVELATPFANLQPKVCPTCTRKDKVVSHARKSIHLTIDENGYTFVTPGVWMTLQTVPGIAGLEMANEVQKPPPIKVGAVEMPTQEILLNDQRFYVPGRNKYESAEVVRKPFLPIIDHLAEKRDRKETAEKAKKRKIYG